MAERGVSCNVHYKPLPLLYQNMGFRMEDYQMLTASLRNEVTLPLHELLSDESWIHYSKLFRN